LVVARRLGLDALHLALVLSMGLPGFVRWVQCVGVMR
jgi:hypothetical protein